MSKLKVGCPTCDRVYQIDPAWIGRRAQCKKCGATFVLTAGPAQTPPAAPAAAAPVKQAAICPSCGRELRTPLAQQCFECGADWRNGVAGGGNWSTPVQSSPPAPPSASSRVRALAAAELDESRLASDSGYRQAKMKEFGEIIEAAKEACRKAGHAECLGDLDRISGLGLILYLGWPALRPALESSSPMGMFAYTVMVVGCWTTPQGAIRHFALHEKKASDSDEDVVKLIAVTASSLQQMIAKLGLR